MIQNKKNTYCSQVYHRMNIFLDFVLEVMHVLKRRQATNLLTELVKIQGLD